MIYWQKLSGATDEQFAEAVSRVLTREKFFPSIATLHGTIEQVQAEWHAAYLAASPDERRYSVAEVLLPTCDRCLDSGWTAVPSPHPNQPSSLVKCECGQAIKGYDPRHHRNQHGAAMYIIQREQARHPPFDPDLAAKQSDPARAAADLADALRMERRAR